MACCAVRPPSVVPAPKAPTPLPVIEPAPVHSAPAFPDVHPDDLGAFDGGGGGGGEWEGSEDNNAPPPPVAPVALGVWLGSWYVCTPQPVRH